MPQLLLENRGDLLRAAISLADENALVRTLRQSIMRASLLELLRTFASASFRIEGMRGARPSTAAMAGSPSFRI